MRSRSGWSSLALVLALTGLPLAGLPLAGVARADVITLENGHTIEGEVVGETETEVELRIANGSTTIPRSRIVRIEKKPTPEQELIRRRGELDPKDAAGRVALARFVLEKHFRRQVAAELALEAWRIDPASQGAIELLEKLDYRFEGEGWIDAERWYPRHGFLKLQGRWVTTEELALRDVVALVRQAEGALGVAQGRVAETEGYLAAAPAAEAEARGHVDEVKAEVDGLKARRAAAKATLDARETDLRIAADKTIAARRDLALIQQGACPNDARARADYDCRLAAADAVVRSAIVEENRARAARDAQLQVVEELATAEANAATRVRDAEAAVAAIQVRARAAADELPRRKADVAAAETVLSRTRDSERAARAAVEERHGRDREAALARTEALRLYAEKRKADGAEGTK